MDPEIEAMLQRVNSGEISFHEFQAWGYKRTQQIEVPHLLTLMENGQWNDFVDLALKRYELLPIAFRYFDNVPDHLKYDFAIQAYIHHGDSVPAVRKAVRTAWRYGTPTLPEEIRSQEIITIYRAGEEPIEKTAYRISWTTSREIAIWFYRDYAHKHANHFYQGKIRTSDIIAYTDDREEKEVMQYRKVFDIEELTDIE